MRSVTGFGSGREWTLADPDDLVERVLSVGDDVITNRPFAYVACSLEPEMTGYLLSHPVSFKMQII